MNPRSTTLIAVVLTFGLFATAESTLAQSNCHQAKGELTGLFDPATNSTTGQISKGGWLNGSTLEAFEGAVLPTADPTTVSFTGDFTLATAHGELKARNVYIFDFVTGVASAFARIDPSASGGAFAGATGVLYFAGTTTSFDPFTTQAEVTGEICFAG